MLHTECLYNCVFSIYSIRGSGFVTRTVVKHQDRSQRTFNRYVELQCLQIENFVLTTFFRPCLSQFGATSAGFS
jgi:hypothetical protein